MRVPLMAAAAALVFTLGPPRLAAPPFSAQPGAAYAQSSPAVARVGTHVITAADLDRRLAGVPPFQLKSFGRTPEEVRRNFLERVMVRELLFSAGAEAAGLARRADVEDRLRSVLKGAMLGRLRHEAATSVITEKDIRDYYDENRAKFNSPPRIAIWRILVGSRAEAEKLIADAGKELVPKRWNELARERSLDKATGMRGGNLGFVAPDGTTGEAGVKVDPALFAAAAQVEDAKLVPAPVKEGDHWAVLWRRQSMKAVSRTVEQEALSIKQVLAHARTEKTIKALLARLRTETNTDVQHELVDQLDVGASGDIQPARRPGSLPATRRAASPVPTQTPGGLR